MFTFVSNIHKTELYLYNILKQKTNEKFKKYNRRLFRF